MLTGGVNVNGGAGIGVLMRWAWRESGSILASQSSSAVAWVANSANFFNLPFETGTHFTHDLIECSPPEEPYNHKIIDTAQLLAGPLQCAILILQLATVVHDRAWSLCTSSLPTESIYSNRYGEYDLIWSAQSTKSVWEA